MIIISIIGIEFVLRLALLLLIRLQKLLESILIMLLWLRLSSSKRLKTAFRFFPATFFFINSVKKKFLAEEKKTSKTYRCTVSANSLSLPFNLFIRMRVHSRDWPYKCKICNEMLLFFSGPCLSSRMRVYTRERLYRYIVLAEIFCFASNLSRNVRVRTGECIIAKCGVKSFLIVLVYTSI